MLGAGAMASADAWTINTLGIPGVVLMERAALSLCAFVRERYPWQEGWLPLILAGPGNNGGDALALARLLGGFGYRPRVFQWLPRGQEGLSPSCALQRGIWEGLGGRVEDLRSVADIEAILDGGPGRCLVVDGLFGAGLNRPLTDAFWGDLFGLIAKRRARVLAVDVPSGLGEGPVGGAVLGAHDTVTFAFPKRALFWPDGSPHTGRIHVRQIGIPLRAVSPADRDWVLNLPDLQSPLMAPRPLLSHKGSLGHVLVLGGMGYRPGAGFLAARAALEGGAGRVTWCTDRPENLMLLSAQPALMGGVLAEDLDRLEAVADVVVLGPGLGLDEQARSLLRRLWGGDRPLLLDADALTLLAGERGSLGPRGAGVILTPHPGEWCRLSGRGTDVLLQERLRWARMDAEAWGHVLVAKGHRTLIAATGVPGRINVTGNPGMATAGAGDVLAGLIAALWARGGGRTDLAAAAAAVGVGWHGAAGDVACRRRGEASLTASDIVDALPEGWHEWQNLDLEYLGA